MSASFRTADLGNWCSESLLWLDCRDQMSAHHKAAHRMPSQIGQISVCGEGVGRSGAHDNRMDVHRPLPLGKPITHENGQRWANVFCYAFAGNTPRTQNHAKVVMSVLAHSPREEKISSTLQSPRSCARIFHPLWMPSKKGLCFSLTFFVMFCHAHIIVSQDADFNKKVEVASLPIN